MIVGLTIRGRGATGDPPNRFEPIVLEPDGDTLDADHAAGDGPPAGAKAIPTQVFRDASRSIIAYNDSPDVGFDASINPYRGCEHGCAYCYARPYHEYLGLSAGLDFETKVFAKLDAAALLRKELAARSWRPQRLGMSGITDPYQPVERKLRISRACLEVLADFRNPVGIVTKSHLVTRDVDLLAELARFDCAAVHISITTLRKDVARLMEPRASSPAQRLAAVRVLADAGVPVGILVAPVVPGLTDHEPPEIVRAAADAGARWAGAIPVVRLPGAVKDVFVAWARERYPDRAERILNRIREMRGGKLNESRFGARFRGEGPYAEQIMSLFRAARARAGLGARSPELSIDHFRVPPAPGGQMSLF